MAECLAENTNETFDFFFQYIFINTVDLPSVGHNNLTDFENRYILPRLAVIGPKREYLFLDFDFCPFLFTYVCGIRMGERNYSTRVILNKTEYPRGLFTVLNDNASECTFVKDIDNFQYYCLFFDMNTRMGDPEVPQYLEIPYQMLYKNINLINNTIYFNYLYLQEEINCYCVQTISLSPVTDTITVHFKLPLKNFTMLQLKPYPYRLRELVICTFNHEWNFTGGSTIILCNFCKNRGNNYFDYVCARTKIFMDSVLFLMDWQFRDLFCKCSKMADLIFSEIIIQVPKNEPLVTVSNYQPHGNLTCTANASFNEIYWSCKFKNLETKLGVKGFVLPNKTDQNLYDSLLVNNATLSLYYYSMLENIVCECIITIVLYDYFTFRKYFTLPRLDIVKLVLNPSIPVIFQQLECLAISDLGDLVYFWFCQTTSNENTKTEFIDDLKIKDNKLELDYGLLNEEYRCECRLKFAYFIPPETGPKIEFVLPQSETIMLQPADPKLFDSVSCLSNIRKNFNHSWYCNMDNFTVALMNLSYENILSPESRYIFKNIFLLMTNEIKLNFHFNTQRINCWCEVTYKSKYFSFQRKSFMLPTTDMPEIFMNPKEFSYNTFITCSSNFPFAFEYDWRCTYKDYVINFTTSNDDAFISEEVKYFIRSVWSKNEIIYVKNSFFTVDSHCECFMRILGEPEEFPSVVGFTLKKTDNLFRYMRIDCSYRCKYNAHEHELLVQISNITYPEISLYSSYRIFSRDLNFYRKYPNSEINPFYPLESVRQPFSMLCATINWDLVWKKTNDSFMSGSWKIMIYNNTGKGTITTNYFQIYISAFKYSHLNCSLVDYYGQNAITMFRVNPILWINLFYVDQGLLKLISNFNFKGEINITCGIFIYTSQTKGWCQRFKIGEMFRILSMEYYKNFTVILNNFQERDALIKVDVEMYFPFQVTIELLTSNTKLKFTTSIIYYPKLPSYTAFIKLSPNSSHGFYQIFYTYQWNPLNYRKHEIINYGVYVNKLSLYLNPSRSDRGFFITCLINSLNMMFIFQWRCLIGDSYITLLSNISQYDDEIREKYAYILDNLILINPQSLRFQYLLKPDFYYCTCSAISYAASNVKINISEPYVFNVVVYDFPHLKPNFQNVHLNLVIVSLVWSMNLVVCFFILALYQHNLYHNKFMRIQLYKLMGLYVRKNKTNQKKHAYTKYYILGNLAYFSKYFGISFSGDRSSIFSRGCDSTRSKSIFKELGSDCAALSEDAYQDRRNSLLIKLKNKKSRTEPNEIPQQENRVFLKSKGAKAFVSLHAKKDRILKDRIITKNDNRDLRYFRRPSFQFGERIKFLTTESNLSEKEPVK